MAALFEASDTRNDERAQWIRKRNKALTTPKPLGKIKEGYEEVALRQQAQKYVERSAEIEEDSNERARMELLWLNAWNEVMLANEPFKAEDVERILTEERTHPTQVFTHTVLHPSKVTARKAPAVSPTPKIPENAFYGIAGRIINKIRPNTESHPIGNLLEFLASFGNIIGATAYYKIEDTNHYTNINVVTVGKTSKARKGTGVNRINRITSELDKKWFDDRRTSGLGSGEIVISLVRDRQIGPVKKKNGELVTEVTDFGVDDKRLFVSEGEFAGILAVGGREGNMLSKVIRDAWDHQPIRNMAKSGSSICMYPHISISANITREELLLQMREADRFNGFGNRFLWCYVERQGSLPHGGEDLEWSKEIEELNKCIAFAKKQLRVFMDRNAREMWKRIYEDLSQDAGGVVGAVTSRGEAQVIRLALIFSVLDCSEHITIDHLKAAKAIWDYCEDSATFVFGGTTREQHTLLQFLAGGSKSITTIREELYQRHRTVSEIEADLQRLIEIGQAVKLVNENGKPVYSPVRG